MGWGEGQMLEIDDRYPEYARPYEPIKGRHRHGPLKGNESALLKMRRLRRLDLARRGFLTGVGVLIMLAFLMPAPKHDFNIPDLKPAIIKPVKPKPDPQPQPVPVPDPEPRHRGAGGQDRRRVGRRVPVRPDRPAVRPGNAVRPGGAGL